MEKLPEILLDIFKNVQQHLGTTIAFLIFVIGFMAWYILKQHSKALEAKDKEIDRLNENCQRMQEVLIPGLKKIKRSK